jgi:ATP-binding cassette subfamily B protein
MQASGFSDLESFGGRGGGKRAAAMALDPARRPDAPLGDIGLFWTMLRPHRWRLAAAIGLNALHGWAIAFQVVMVKYLIDALTLPGMTTTQRWTQVGWLIGAYLLISIVGRMAMWHIGFRIMRKVMEVVVRETRARFFRHVNNLCLRFHVRHSSGELFSYLFGSTINEVVQFANQTANGVPGALVTILSTLVWVAWWDAPLAGILFAAVLLNVALMHRSRRAIRSMTVEFQRFENQVTGRVSDLLRGSRAVKVHGIEDDVTADFAAQAGELGAMSYRVAVRRHIHQMQQEATGYLAFAVLCAAVAWRYLDGAIGAGEIAASLTAFVGLQGPMQMLFQAVAQWGSAQASLERIAGVLGTASTTPDPPPAEAVALPRGELRFERVSFAYDPGAGAVLHDIDLRIPEGQRVALVGPSGAGKSTLAQLALRLYDPGSGSVSIGGVDLRQVRGAELRRRLGVVPQDPFIFRTTIRENLTLLRRDADEGLLRAACERARAWEFIARSPQGLDTPVGEGGWTLSGGQRQRLAIARVLLADPHLLIFDEATSALDSLSEKLIQEAIEDALGGRTALFIAHRLSTVRNCHRIIVLDRGRVVQDGTYDRLAADPGLFRDLVRGQALLTGSDG